MLHCHKRRGRGRESHPSPKEPLSTAALFPNNRAILPPEPEEAAMQSLISDLVARFERGQLSRRDFVGTLAALAATGPSAAAAAAPAAQPELDFKTAII